MVLLGTLFEFLDHLESIERMLFVLVLEPEAWRDEEDGDVSREEEEVSER